MAETKQSGKPIDFSIMPSFRCNLRCWFCMYDCGPDNATRLNLSRTSRFLEKFDWSMINAFGFYGGEVSIDLPLYDKFIALVPDDLPKFVITNGTWSQDDDQTHQFLQWCTFQRLHVIVSSTSEHVAHQKRNLLEALSRESRGWIELKNPDEIHAQGRAKGKPGVRANCGKSCLRPDRNIRLGLKPDGNIVYQNCHGEYHVVQTYDDPFDGIVKRTLGKKLACLAVK